MVRIPRTGFKTPQAFQPPKAQAATVTKSPVEFDMSKLSERDIEHLQRSANPFFSEHLEANQTLHKVFHVIQGHELVFKSASAPAILTAFNVDKLDVTRGLGAVKGLRERFLSHYENFLGEGQHLSVVIEKGLLSSDDAYTLLPSVTKVEARLGKGPENSEAAIKYLKQAAPKMTVVRKAIEADAAKLNLLSAARTDVEMMINVENGYNGTKEAPPSDAGAKLVALSKQLQRLAGM